MPRVLEAGGWGLAGLALWLTTLSSVTMPEALCAAGTALVSGAFSPLMRRALGDAWRPRARWLVLPLLVPWRAVTEVAPVVRAVVRRRTGRLHRVDLPAEPDRTRACRAALMILAPSATPGRLVVHVDDGLRCFVVHDLVPPGRQVEEVLTGGRAARR